MNPTLQSLAGRVAIKWRTTISLIAVLLAVAVLTSPLAYAQSIRFEDGTPTSGIQELQGSHGVSVVDYNNDGFDDVLITSQSGSSLLYRNNGDATFVDATAESGLDLHGGHVVGIWSDVNNDGWLDLYAGSRTGSGNRLLLGSPEGVFEDVTEGANIDKNVSVGSATWGDVNGDGLVDLFVATRDSVDALYIQMPGVEISFVDQAITAGVAGDAWSVAMQPTFVDFDKDGDQDMFCVHDGTYLNRMYLNDTAYPMKNVAEDMGIASAGAGNGMGVSWADIDGDGWDDVYITRIGRAGFFRNLGGGSFENIAASSGAEPNGMSWGNVFGDYDLDGDVDLLVVSSYGFDDTPSLLYENDGTGHFSEIGRAAGAQFNGMDSFGAASGDFNGDGLLDLFLTDSRGHNRVLLNSTASAGTWIKFQLKGDPSNRAAVGATIDVFVDARVVRRTISAGDSYTSQSSLTVHMGLAGASAIDSAYVYWPSGGVSRLPALASGMTHQLSEPSLSTSVPKPATRRAMVLEQSFPNPARDLARIRFSAEPGHVRIAFFDLLGRSLRTVFVGSATGEPQDIEVDLSTFRAGLYMYRLETTDYSMVRMLTIVR